MPNATATVNLHTSTDPTHITLTDLTDRHGDPLVMISVGPSLSVLITEPSVALAIASAAADGAALLRAAADAPAEAAQNGAYDARNGREQRQYGTIRLQQAYDTAFARVRENLLAG